MVSGTRGGTPTARRHGPEPARYTIRDVPRLTLSKRLRRPPPRHDPGKEYQFRYRAKRHGSLPHVVKFSGGRSSGMLLFALLENGLLDASRGDVIVFNNTSAEHPDTYRFVRDCMRTARRYGIPFFQVEFQTYEDARQGEWTRLPTYRLVNDRPKSAANDEGFHWRGEVYEELLSWSGYVPNQFNRICTKHLKLDVTRNFLKDWLASKATIPRLGHHGNGSRMDPDEAWRRHRKNQGGVPEDIFLRKRAYAWSRPHVRPEQRYRDFYPEWQPFQNEALEGKTFGDKAWFGKKGVEYVAFIGLRGDEPHRIQRVEARNDTAAGYEGEHVYMPLNDMAVTRGRRQRVLGAPELGPGVAQGHEPVQLRVLLPQGRGEPRRHPRRTGKCPGHRGARIRTARRHAVRSAVVDEDRGAVRPGSPRRKVYDPQQRDPHRVLRKPPVRLQGSGRRTGPRRAERDPAAVRLHGMTPAPVYLDHQATTPLDPRVREGKR